MFLKINMKNKKWLAGNDPEQACKLLDPKLEKNPGDTEFSKIYGSSFGEPWGGVSQSFATNPKKLFQNQHSHKPDAGAVVAQSPCS